MSEEKEKKQGEKPPEEKSLKAVVGDNVIIQSKHELIVVFPGTHDDLRIYYRPNENMFVLSNRNTNGGVSFDSVTALSLIDILLKNAINAKTNEEEQSDQTIDLVWNEIVEKIKKLHESIRSNQKKEADVYIAIPQKDTDLFQVERLQNAVGDLMETLGYEMETKEEPIHGSFYQRLKFLLKEPKTQEELEKVFKVVKLAAETKYVGNPTADETQKIADATAKLIEAANKFDSVVIRAERILLVKAEINGKTHLKVQTLSPTLMQLLDEQPHLMDNSELMLQLISDKQSKPKALEGGETPAISGT